MGNSADLLVRLNSITYGAKDINVYTFASLNSEKLPAVTPGAHLDLEVTEGVVRQYSLINSGDDLDEYKIAVKRDENGRGGSLSFHDRSVVGKKYKISYPRNNFEIKESEKDFILLAGGIGITPLLSMYDRLKSAGKQVELHYWARTNEHFLMRKVLERDPNVHFYATEGAPSDMPTVATVLARASDSAQLYCCGPSNMVIEFEETTKDRLPDNVHLERFVAKEQVKSSSAFVVHCSKSNTDVRVSPEESILEACLRAGIDMQYSCEEGICGACEVRVIKGKVIHNDSVKKPERHDADHTMMVCCSRAADESLTIDV